MRWGYTLNKVTWSREEREEPELTGWRAEMERAEQEKSWMDELDEFSYDTENEEWYKTDVDGEFIYDDDEEDELMETFQSRKEEMWRRLKRRLAQARAYPSNILNLPRGRYFGGEAGVKSNLLPVLSLWMAINMLSGASPANIAQSCLGVVFWMIKQLFRLSTNT